MKKTLFHILIILFPVLGFAQSEDFIISNMCTEFKNTGNLSDSARVENMYSKYLYPHLEKIESPNTIDSTGNAIYFRLQRECEEFRKFLFDRSRTEHWEIVYEMPRTDFTAQQKKEFEKISEFYYYEGETNTITNVKLRNGFWIDEFPDHTHSKNKFSWENSHKFVLEHVDSNNEGRKGFSRKGDQYYYSVINKGENYYLVAAQIPDQREILLFKLYIK